MPDDRFEDLDPSSRAPSAAERLAARDELDAREEEREPEPERRSRPFVVFAGLALVVLVSLAALYQTFSQPSGTGPGGSGVSGLTRGERVPDAAAPLAFGGVEGDANVTPAGLPPSVGRPACSVRAPGVTNLCELRKRPLVLSFVVLRGTDCEPALDVLERVSGDFPDVAFLAVVSGESRAEVDELARDHRLSVPVAVDPDGALINAFRLGVCPAVTLAEPGGRVTGTRIGPLTEAQLRDLVRPLAGRG